MWPEPSHPMVGHLSSWPGISVEPAAAAAAAATAATDVELILSVMRPHSDEISLDRWMVGE